MIAIIAATISILAIVALFVIAVEIFLGWLEQHARRIVTCPEKGEEALIQLDALRNALPLALQRKPKLTIQKCSFWPEKKLCDQRCLASPASCDPER